MLLLDVTGSEDVLAQAAWPGGISSAVRQAKAGAQDNLVMGKLHILFSQDQDQVGDQPQEERGNLAHSLRHDDSMVLLCNLLGLALARAMFGLHSCGLKKVWAAQAHSLRHSSMTLAAFAWLEHKQSAEKHWHFLCPPDAAAFCGR